MIPVSVLPWKLCNPVHIQRTSNGKLTQPLSCWWPHWQPPFQRCNLSLHRWPSSPLLQRSWVCFQGGCCKTPGVFIEGSKTTWWRDDDRRASFFRLVGPVERSGFHSLDSVPDSLVTSYVNFIKTLFWGSAILRVKFRQCLFAGPRCDDGRKSRM